MSTRTHEKIQTRLQDRLGAGLIVICRDTAGDISSLWPEEVSAISDAIPKRQREFAAGRTSAREALLILNGHESPIPSNPDRSPLWPDSLVGSIAHTSETCLVVVGRRMDWRSVGIDIEPRTGIDEALWSIICTPEEMHMIQNIPTIERAEFVARVFVAKEAFYKWFHPQTKKLLDFQDAKILWSKNRSTFQVVLNTGCDPDLTKTFMGQLLVIEDHLIAYCTTRYFN